MDKNEASCDLACISEATCVAFEIGKTGTNVAGNCLLYKAGSCTKKNDLRVDVYTSTPKVNPSKAASVCTHLSQLL